jgi:hypothetical protein
LCTCGPPFRWRLEGRFSDFGNNRRIGEPLSPLRQVMPRAYQVAERAPEIFIFLAVADHAWRHPHSRLRMRSEETSPPFRDSREYDDI